MAKQICFGKSFSLGEEKAGSRSSLLRHKICGALKSVASASRPWLLYAYWPKNYLTLKLIRCGKEMVGRLRKG